MSTKVSNEGPAEDGAWGHLIRLQSEYQARLTEETMRYLRSLQAAFSPRPPGTVVQANGAHLSGAGTPGTTVSFDVDIENRQRVHTPVYPSLSPLLSATGATWYPEAEFDPPALIVGPDETQALAVAVSVPAAAPPATYRGSLVLQGFSSEGIPVEIIVEGSPADAGSDAATAEESAPS